MKPTHTFATGVFDLVRGYLADLESASWSACSGQYTSAMSLAVMYSTLAQPVLTDRVAAPNQSRWIPDAGPPIVLF